MSAKRVGFRVWIKPLQRLSPIESQGRCWQLATVEVFETQVAAEAYSRPLSVDHSILPAGDVMPRADAASVQAVRQGMES